jgi:hypothetical protein
MALTLIEVAKTEQDELRRGVIEKFAYESVILERIPFMNIEGNAYQYNVEERLPGIAFRGVNEAFDEGTGVINPQTETLKVMGGDADSDLYHKRTQRIQDRRSIDTKMKIKAASLYFNKTFIDGNNSSDPKEPDGLNQRLTGDQVKYAGANGANLSKNFVHQVIDAVDGRPDGILMGKKMHRQFQNLFEASTIMTIQEDAFGRKVKYFDDIPILILDKDNSGNVILDFDETRGNSDVTASFYVVKWGEEYVCGIQSGPLDARDLGEIDAKPVERTRIEWDIGFIVMSPRAAARGAGITAAVS